MIFLKPLGCLFLLFIFSVNASLYDDLEPDKLKNDKDVLVTVLEEEEVTRLKGQYSLSYAQSLFPIIERSLLEFNENAKACDLGFAAILDQELQSAGIESRFYSEFFAMMRAHNQIDDIFYDILNKSMAIHLNTQKSLADGAPINPPRFLFTPRVLKRNNVANLFENFQSWPDEEEECSLGLYYQLANNINSKWQKASQRDLELLNHRAFEYGHIDEQTFKRLQVLAQNEALSWPIYIGGYLDKIMNAKNIMQYSDPINLDEVQNIYASQYYKRAEKVTRRKDLYYKYNPTQIVMLSQIMEKVSMRMGVDPHTDTSTPQIVTNYVVRRDGETREFSEVYFLSPSEQFTFARKRLRLDMLELAGTKTFKGVTIEYEDIILAALETGYINHHDLEYVVEYDDLWNPDVSPWKKYKDFVWSFSGSAAFYLPTPWNVVGAIGLVFVNSKISKGQNGHDNHENPANIFN